MELFSVTLSVVSTSVDHLVRNSNPIVIEAFIFYYFWNQTNILMSKFDFYTELLRKTFEIEGKKLPGLEYSLYLSDLKIFVMQYII